ncbi:unnamed protein product [Auanema sp. JU1783]|nr:unnamed protein product [Auanema sp. JU1783]
MYVSSGAMILVQFPIILTFITPEVFSYSKEFIGSVKKVSGDANIQKIQENLDVHTIYDKHSLNLKDKTKENSNRETSGDSSSAIPVERIKMTTASVEDEVKTEDLSIEDRLYNQTDTLDIGIIEQSQYDIRTKTLPNETSGMDDTIFYSNDIFSSEEGSGMIESNKHEIHPPAPPTSVELRSATILPYSSESIETIEGSGLLNSEDHSTMTNDYSQMSKSSLEKNLSSNSLDRYVLSPFEKTVMPKQNDAIRATTMSINSLTTSVKSIKTLESISSAKERKIYNGKLSARKRWHPFVFDCMKEEDNRGMLCKEWALAGFCSDNRPTMFLFCRKTCLCTGPELEIF